MVNDFSKVTVIIRASLFYVNNLIPFLFIYFQKELHHLSTSISIHLFSSKVPILKESYSMTSHFTPPIPSAVLIPSPVNRKELTIMTAWQYSGAGMINNYVAIGSALFGYLTVPIILPLIVVFVMKFFGGVVCRIALNTIFKGDFQDEQQ